ncbi:MAG: hypothetical protein Q9213_001579 [Squamulea squamosa]
MSGQLQRSSPAESDHNSATENDSSDEGEQVESLVTGRAKRATAGTRMSALLEKEGDDELELLFAEDEQEEDNEFEADDFDDASDVQLDSASSDDEQSPTKGDDDLEGEKELQRQTRVEKQRKRKAQDALMKPSAMKKRIGLPARSDAPAPASVPTTPAPRPKKKSERVSWLPTPEEGPIRASSRKQTVRNKEITNIRLVASEKRRRQQLQVMEEAAKRKEASKPRAMTQAQRMEEAARVERLNAKSLNRWEAAEKKRVVEQKAKLEALHNRQLTGPVISWWSGMARWVNGKLKQVGWKSVKEADAKSNTKPVQPDHLVMDRPASESLGKPMDENTIMQDAHGPPPAHPLSEPAREVEEGTATSTPQALLAPPTGPEGFLDGIHYYASLPEYSGGDTIQGHGSIFAYDKAMPEPSASSTRPSVTSDSTLAAVPKAALPGFPTIEYSGRNVVILEDIDANAQRLPDLQNHVLLKKRNGKPQKPARELCAITDQPAKYRDPRTGLSYADSRGQPGWSSNCAIPVVIYAMGDESTVARKTAVKAARPATLGAPKSTLQGNGKVKQAKDKPKEKEEEVIACDDGDMATSFLQFCVTCDRQILVPNNSLLYCSERCKRMDAQHVSDYSSYVSIQSPMSGESDDNDPLGSKNPPIVPPAIPTPRPDTSARIPPEAHEGKSDLDPTEWKPKSHDNAIEWKPKIPHRPTSDASKYLSQFHRTPPTLGSPRCGSSHRPTARLVQNTDSVSMNAPSLSATPSTSSTSSSSASIAGTPYDFIGRPSMCSRPSTVHSKSADLVTPQKIAYSVPTKPKSSVHGKFSVKVSELAAPSVVVENATWSSSDLSYAKKWNWTPGRHIAGSGSLTNLLGAANSGHKATL